MNWIGRSMPERLSADRPRVAWTPWGRRADGVPEAFGWANNRRGPARRLTPVDLVMLKTEWVPALRSGLVPASTDLWLPAAARRVRKSPVAAPERSAAPPAPTWPLVTRPPLATASVAG